MINALYSSSILMRFELSRQSFIKCSNIKFQENPSSGSRVVPCGQTDRYVEANIDFLNFTNAAKKSLFFSNWCIIAFNTTFC